MLEKSLFIFFIILVLGACGKSKELLVEEFTPKILVALQCASKVGEVSNLLVTSSHIDYSQGELVMMGSYEMRNQAVNSVTNVISDVFGSKKIDLKIEGKFTAKASLKNSLQSIEWREPQENGIVSNQCLGK